MILPRALLVGIGLLWVMQLALDFFSNFLGGGLTIIGDLVLGGMQFYLAYRLSLLALERLAAR